jgi:hypothetical protein
MGKQEVQRYILEADETTECVVWDQMHRSVDLMLVSSRIEVVNLSRTEMETGLKVRHRHLGRVPSNTLLSHSKVAMETRDAINIKADPSDSRDPFIFTHAKMGRRQISGLEATVDLLSACRTRLAGKIILQRSDSGRAEDLRAETSRRFKVSRETNMLSGVLMVLKFCCPVAVNAASSKCDKLVCQLIRKAVHLIVVVCIGDGR